MREKKKKRKKRRIYVMGVCSVFLKKGSVSLTHLDVSGRESS